MALYTEHSRKFVNNFLMHALIPNQYANSIYDFISRFNKIVLKNRDESEHQACLEYIAEIFDKGDSDKYPELQNMNLIKSTKLALSDTRYFSNTFLKIIKRMMNNMEEGESLNLGIFEESFKTWLLTQNAKKKDTRMEFNENPYIHFNAENGKTYMMIPGRGLSSESRTLKVLSGEGEILESRIVNVYEQFGMFVADEQTMEIRWDPLDDFYIVIGNETIYKNNNRGHIILSKKGKSRKRLSMGFNMAIVGKEADISIEHNIMGEFAKYNVVGFIVSRGESVSIDKHHYEIETEIFDSLGIMTGAEDVDCRDEDGSRYNLYSKHPKLSIEINNESKSKFSLSVYDGYNRIHYDSLNEIELDKGCTKSGNVLELDLSMTSLKPTDGIYTIRCKRKVFKYILLNGFNYTFEDEIYLENKESFVTWSHGEKIQFNTEDGLLKLPEITFNNTKLSMTLEIPSNRYSFDKKKWHLFDSEDIYFRNSESHDYLFIYCPKLMYPQIMPIYQGGRKLDLNIDGHYLVCETSKINQLGMLFEKGRIYEPYLKFKCGEHNLFTIRYTADYTTTDNEIKRRNAPEYTSFHVQLDDGTSIENCEEYCELPPEYCGTITIVEDYDEGFGPLSRIASVEKIGLRIEMDEGEVIAGNADTKITVRKNRKKWIVPPEDIHYLIEPEGNINNAYIDDIKSCYKESDESLNHSISAYDSVCDYIKTTLLKDDNINRLKMRARKFEKVDLGFTIELYRRVLELCDDSESKYMVQKLTTS